MTTPATNTPTSNDTALEIASSVSGTLQRRGYLTTEWWTTVAAALLSSLLVVFKVHGPVAVQIVGVAAPVFVAAIYAVVRTMHKSRLAELVADAFPQNNDTP